MEKLDYWKKEQNLKGYDDYKWNIPEQKTGTVALVGGNSQNFASTIKTAEFLGQNFPVNKLNVVLPDALKSKLPPLPDLLFTPSTESGSLAKSGELNTAVANADFAIFAGDLSKNSATTIAVAESIKNADTPAILVRDSVDLLSTEMSELLEHGGLYLLASMSQLQKLLRAIYYPKMLLLSMPLMQAVEVLHKFTLSFPVTVITFHQEQIIVASDGKVTTLPIAATSYTPLTLWSGELASKIAMMNLYNPGKLLEATLASFS